ncbi:TBC domain containing protein [Theileria equi strain WA]|uniref:TBC domain containing protein n=1 Tax=Theileria equi strain WA TaxID=1537102 RepID=L0AXB4_THEEQ|nr:TBC domain containing protein [Theileria equi strain WA]AFZ79666.1 TBC domain containing protein [Theileria equi strain WA]|eukprot:XP_004829332.1 TBC domain containing protein [Theileria equi strain WA]
MTNKNIDSRIRRSTQGNDDSTSICLDTQYIDTSIDKKRPKDVARRSEDTGVSIGNSSSADASTDGSVSGKFIPKKLSIFPLKKLEAQNGSWFDVFGFGKSVLQTPIYGLAIPQCSCERVPSNPLLYNIEEAIKGKSKLKGIPKQVKGERCTRFNQWWLKCCQSAVFKQSGIYWTLIHLLEVKVNVDGKESAVCDLVLGGRTTLAIELDIRRTYPSLRFYNKYGRSMLRRILMAYAFFDPEVGYVQGLNFIVANLLWHSSEEQAFWALISLMYLYDLRPMFLPGLPGVFKRCEILEHVMAKHLPALHAHLRNVGVHIPMISSDWFMTLCANSIPIKPLGRLWDSFFSEGWVTIFRFIIFRLRQFEKYLLTMSDIADIMKVIKYGNTNITERWSFTDFIPGFGSNINKKKLELINAAYSTNVENLTNDPNRNSNENDWLSIVEESLSCNVEASYIEELDLTNSEILYHDCTHVPIDSFDSVLGLTSQTSRDEPVATPMSDNLFYKTPVNDNSPERDPEFMEAHSNEENSDTQEYVDTFGVHLDTEAEMDDRLISKLQNKHIHEAETHDGLPIHLLEEKGLGDVAKKLTNLANSFKAQLAAIGVSNAYSLHLRALHDE